MAIKRPRLTVTKKPGPHHVDDMMYYIPDTHEGIGEVTEATENMTCAPIHFTADGLPHNPLTRKGRKIMSSMRKQYGSRAKQVFYRSANKGTISGVHK